MGLVLFFWFVYVLFLVSEWWGYFINTPRQFPLHPLTLTALAACVLVRVVHFMNQSCEIWQSDIAMHIFTRKNLVWLFWVGLATIPLGAKAGEGTTVVLGICMVAGSLWQRHVLGDIELLRLRWEKSKNQEKGETK